MRLLVGGTMALIGLITGKFNRRKAKKNFKKAQETKMQDSTHETVDVQEQPTYNQPVVEE
jgi:hypothetical protein